MTDSSDSSSVHSRAEEFLQVFKKGAEFTQGLLKENERLRFRLLELEQSQRAETSTVELQLLKEKLQLVEAEKKDILDKIGTVEQQNLDFTNRYAEIEADNNLLANLYITTYQLHSTFEVNEIFRVIEEILLNLVGAEEFSLFFRDEDNQLIQSVVNDEGELEVHDVENTDPRIELALAEGQNWIPAADELPQLDASAVKAAIPLLVDGKVIGVLAIYRLLAQKNGFTEIDEEIFALLGGHAAMAICTAVLRQENTGQIDFKRGLLPRT